jgi:hypothetical protein
MPIRKIQAGRIITVNSLDYVGEHGAIFYDENLADLRISDGHTPGGRKINLTGGLDNVLIEDLQTGQTLQYNGTRWVNVNPGAVGLSTATTTQLGGVKVGSNINISPDGVISVSTGAGINKVIDIPDVNSNGLAEGSVLIYNSAMARWDLTNSLVSDSTESADGGEF